MRDALICLVNTACKLQSLDNGDEDDDDSGGLHRSVCMKFCYKLYFIAEDNKKEVHVDQVCEHNMYDIDVWGIWCELYFL